MSVCGEEGPLPLLTSDKVTVSYIGVSNEMIGEGNLLQKASQRSGRFDSSTCQPDEVLLSVYSLHSVYYAVGTAKHLT